LYKSEGDDPSNTDLSITCVNLQTCLLRFGPFGKCSNYWKNDFPILNQSDSWVMGS